MQAESGQPIEVIIRRKELERANGNGLFYWGIGNDLRKSMRELTCRTSSPEVLFSIMPSKPKKLDRDACSLLLWTEYLDADGSSRQLPSHALVISRAHTFSLKMKKKCYALVCYSEKKLPVRDSPPIAKLNFAHFKNIMGKKGKLGFSQVTANIEHDPWNDAGKSYPVNIRADLKQPYFIELAGAKEISDSDCKEMNEILKDEGLSVDAWLTFVEAMRNRYAKPLAVWDNPDVPLADRVAALRAKLAAVRKPSDRGDFIHARRGVDGFPDPDAD